MTLVRVSYATSDARTPALTAVVVAVAAVVGFRLVDVLVEGDGRVGAFALVWSTTIAAGAAVWRCACATCWAADPSCRGRGFAGAVWRSLRRGRPPQRWD
ncbi:MAG: hypothetical protein R2704_15865 [Microthrixaceae bacterium]